MVTTSLVYDYEDRVTSISRPGMTTNTFAYNGFGARVSKSDSSGSNTYLRASSGLIGSIAADSGATHTPGVSEKRGTTSTYYHADIKNSVEQTSTGQGVAASKQYDAFGNEVSSSGPWQGPFQYGGAFGYHTDSDYGLKHLGARYYDSTTGRFLSRDPIGDGRNWYAYCGNNPLTRVDPLGLTWYYDQRTGNLWWDDPDTPEFDPVYKGRGFSGKKGEHRDNPASENRRGEGPIPKGRYTIGERRDRKSSGTKLDNLPLTPDPGNEMYGRSGFLIHPGNREGDPSEGCICLSKSVMDEIEESGDNELVVYDSGPLVLVGPGATVSVNPWRDPLGRPRPWHRPEGTGPAMIPGP